MHQAYSASGIKCGYRKILDKSGLNDVLRTEDYKYDNCKILDKSGLNDVLRTEDYKYDNCKILDKSCL